MVNIIQTIKATAYFAGAVLIVVLMNPLAQAVLDLMTGITAPLAKVAYYLAVTFFVLILPYMIFSKIPQPEKGG